MVYSLLLVHALLCDAESHQKERMAGRHPPTPFSSGAEVLVPDTEVDGVTNAMIETRPGPAKRS